MKMQKGKTELGNCALVEFYAAYVGSLLSTFRDNLSFPTLRVKQSKKTARSQKMGSTCCPETSITNYRPTLRKTPEERAAAETWKPQNITHRGKKKDVLEHADGLPFASSDFVADGASWEFMLQKWEGMSRNVDRNARKTHSAQRE
jgi:hypothetical protein